MQGLQVHFYFLEIVPYIDEYDLSGLIHWVLPELNTAVKNESWLAEGQCFFDTVKVSKVELLRV